MQQNLSQEFPKLNDQQLNMLRLFKSPMSEDDFLEIRHHVVQLLNKQLDNLIDNWEIQNNITEDTYEKWSKEHKRFYDKKNK